MLDLPHPLTLIPPRGHAGRKLALWVLWLAPFAFGFLTLILGQDANWDLRNYHWYNAYAFWNGRYLTDLLPSQTPFFYNPTIDVPFYLLASHVPARVAGFVLGTVQGLNFVLLFMLAHISLRIGNRKHKVIVCALLAALGMLGGGGIAQIGTVFYDNITSLGIFGSALLVLYHFNTLIKDTVKRAAMLALLCGLPAGLMMGLKLPSVIFCVGLCFALPLVAGSLQRRLLIGFMFGVGVLIGVCVSLGHWAWFLQTHFGSPLFPYFNEIFKAPLAPLTSARDTQFLPLNWHDRLLFPFIFAAHPLRVGEVAWRDWRLPLLYILLPVALIARFLFGRSTAAVDAIAEPHAARYLLWVTTLSYSLWLMMFAIYRYAIPMEMLAPLLIMFTVGMLPLKLQTRGIVAAFLLVIVAVTVQAGNWSRRDTWMDNTVSIERPALPDDPKIMLLMAGFEPYSHILSDFPPHIPVTRIQSNFASPDQDKTINQMVAQHLTAHQQAGGTFMLLIPAWEHEPARNALAHFNLMFLPQSCQTVTDHLFNETKFDLCNVETIKRNHDQ